MNEKNKCPFEYIVEVQLNAYNEGDYKTFASCYSSDIVSYDLDSSETIPHLCGLHFFSHYNKKFSENPNLNCKVVQRISHDNLVIDKEIISNFQKQIHQEVVIYQIDQGLITKMWFSKEIS